MDRVLKRRLIVFCIIALFVAGGLFLVLHKDCNEKSVEIKRFVEMINQSSKGEYHIYLNDCYQEAYVINRSDNVDSALFHSMLVKMIEIEDRNYFMNVYSKDSALLYVELAAYNNGDTIYYKVDHYEY